MPCSICRQNGHNCRTCQYKPTLAGRAPVPASLRGPLPDHASIWEYRDQRDAYSNYTRESIVHSFPEKDHVFEIQLLDAAFENYVSIVRAGTTFITRQEESRIKNLANCLENTNVTSMSINRSKKGPFTRAKNDLIKNDFDAESCPGVDSYVYKRNGGRVANKYTGMTSRNWECIKNEVRDSFEHIENSVPDAIHIERNYEAFADALRDTFNSLHID